MRSTCHVHLARVEVRRVWRWRLTQERLDDAKQHNPAEPDVDELLADLGSPGRLPPVLCPTPPPLVPDAYRNPAQEPGGLDRAQQFSHMPPLYVHVPETWHT